MMLIRILCLFSGKKMRNFRELEVWQNGIELTVTAYLLVKQLPKEEIFGLRSQITRAVVSIPSNIAEGCSKSSDRYFKNYLETALGSAFELETHMLLAKRLTMINSGEVDEFLKALQREQKQLNTFIKKLGD
jgi:four helix bundle protein